VSGDPRRTKILAAIEAQGARGIEIGALDRPVLAPPSVRYVDYTTTAELRKDHLGRKSPVERDAIVQVDHIWREQHLAEVLTGYTPLDFAIASHVIEHVPDLARWFRELGEVIRPGGVLSLVVPDRRFTFDRLRSETCIEEVVAAALEERRSPSPQQVYDFYAKHVQLDPLEAWSHDLDHESLKPVHDRAASLSMAREAALGSSYVDCHCWVFTPRSFLDLLEELNQLDWLGFSVHHFFETEPGEIDFFVTLGRLDPADPPAARRRCIEESIAGARVRLSESA